MFLTIGLIIGFAAGWYVNEKFEQIPTAMAKLKFWKKQYQWRRVQYVYKNQKTARGVQETLVRIV